MISIDAFNRSSAIQEGLRGDGRDCKRTLKGVGIDRSRIRFSGASLHHMLDAIGENEIWFEQQLRLLAPLLWRLVDRAGVGVVWRAGDAVGVYAERDATTSDFTVDKIRRYDNIARRVFR